MPVRILSWLDLGRLINVFRLEDSSPQTFRNLGLGLDFDTVFPDDEGVKEVGVRSSSHFRNLDFSRAHLHCERVLFQRVALQRILLQSCLTTHTLLKTMV